VLFNVCPLQTCEESEVMSRLPCRVITCFIMGLRWAIPLTSAGITSKDEWEGVRKNCYCTIRDRGKENPLDAESYLE
jgi:hypothetical protein